MVFQPGESGSPDKIFKPGNPGGPGRPRKGFITDEVARLLEEQHPKQQDKTRKQVLAEQWIRRAGRDQKALDSMVDRLEGKPTEIQEIELKGNGSSPRIVLPAGRAGIPGQPAPPDPEPSEGSTA